MKKVVVTGGGTGGHIYPAISVANHLRQSGNVMIRYFGNPLGMEKRIVMQEGFEMVEITAAGVMNKRFNKQIQSLILTLKGIGQAFRAMLADRPNLIFATGGYVSLPVIVAGCLLRIPVILHEQNAYPGLVNRIGSLWAKYVCLTFDESRPYFWNQKHLVCTGLPIRDTFDQSESAWLERQSRMKEKVILFTGGSQGSKRMNDVVVGIVSDLLSAHFGIIFLTGSTHYETVRDALMNHIPADHLENILLLPYSDDMPQLLLRADLVVARAGASFLTEMNAMGLPGILIPFAQAASNHQLHNALAERNAGAAEVLEEKDLTADALYQTILSFDDEKLRKMSHASRLLRKENALQKIYELMNLFL